MCEQIGAALSDKPAYHVVVVRSTVLPGTTHNVVIPALERTSGKKYGDRFGVSVNPEFLREGTALKDFREPPLTLVGHNHAADATGTISLYRTIDAPLVSTSIGVAEMVKYTGNTWHALKVCFANEIGNVCKRLGVDSHEVMDIFCRDQKLNLSPYYLKPGFAFGGSCLPKDVRALQYRAKELDVDLPVIQSILPSNKLQVQHALDEIIDAGRTKVGILGFSFKDGTDDLRESPMVVLAEALLGKGFQISIYDRNVSLATAGRRQQGVCRAATSAPVVAALRHGRRSDRAVGGHRRRLPIAGVRRRHCRVPRRSDRDRPGAVADRRRARRGRLPRDLLVKVVALMYHDVIPAGHEESSGFAGADAARYKLTPEQFDAHLHAIRARVARAPGTSVMLATTSFPLAGGFGRARSGADVRTAPVSTPLMLTFDDGGRSASRIADALERHGWRGHFFVTSSRIDGPGFLQCGTIRDLRRAWPRDRQPLAHPPAQDVALHGSAAP